MAKRTFEGRGWRMPVGRARRCAALGFRASWFCGVRSLLLVAALLLVPMVQARAAGPAPPAWAAVPIAKWQESLTCEGSDSAKPPYGTWETQPDGTVLATGQTERWSTRIFPGKVAADYAVTVRFTVRESSGVPRALPGGCARWNFYWGENLPGWDFGVVLRYQDPLSFYRVVVSIRGELGLWDAAGGFLQLVPCAVAKGTPHTLEVKAVGARIVAVLDGKAVIDYLDRSTPYGGGLPGLAVYRSRVAIESLAVVKVKRQKEAPVAHKPAFRFVPEDKNLVLYDGQEPISHFWKSPYPGDQNGMLFHEAVKLRPGWRPEYYTAIGPAVDGRWPPLVGELPAAFTLEGGGDTLTYRFQLQDAKLGKTDYTATVSYDTQADAYRYAYQGRHTFGSAVVRVNEYELIDPLTYNNRAPGPEVLHRWNPAGHRWAVYQAPDGWRRFPLTDYLACNAKLAWGKVATFLYPDSVISPVYELDVNWPQPSGREFGLGLCSWGYDYHHREVGGHLDVQPGTVREFGFVLTGLTPAAAASRFAQARLNEAQDKDSAVYVPFDPKGDSCRQTTSAQDPSSTVVWSGSAVRDPHGGRGQAALRIDGPGSADVYLYQYAIEQFAKRWLVSGQFRSEGVRGRGLNLRVKYAYAREPEELFYLGGLDTQDWTPFAFVTTVLQVRDCTSVVFELDGPGKVWLDGVAIRALADDETPRVTSFAVPAGTEPSRDLLIDLGMSEAPGKGMYDESRNGHALYLDGGPAWLQENGRGFLRFDGLKAKGRIPLKPVLEPRDPPPGTTGNESYKPVFRLDTFTYECWIRPQVPAKKDQDMMMVFDYRLNPMVYFDQLTAKPGVCRLVYQNHIFRGKEIKLTQEVPYGVWLHLVAAHGNGRVTLYLNGKVAGETDYDRKGPGFAFFAYKWEYDVGSFVGQQRWLTGDIGPFRLYTRALTADEVAKLYGAWGETTVK